MLLLNSVSETYADNVHPGNNVSKYFLCMMNGSSMLGATL
jgi:MCP family monocarboxylic acid transporter-like MFS transporter 10